MPLWQESAQCVCVLAEIHVGKQNAVLFRVILFDMCTPQYLLVAIIHYRFLFTL